ncbi:MAG TPA: DUF3179 domain-containing (seleno)protein [Patescibacteria group bacterium]|nr:DUF3179 domain-containing (seleno)protein [Patescibacteria group bacterium]
MDKRITIFGVLAVVALIGAGCATGDAKLFGIADSDPSQEISGVGIFDEVVKHKGDKMIVRPSDIVESGQGKDGMPVITDPKFISVDEAIAEGYLFNENYGISVLDDGGYKFYSQQILSWHEILLDEINGTNAAVTYSELSGVSNIFAAEDKDGSSLTFGVSGLLWSNNSLLYDQESDSLWSQVLSKSVYGDHAGEEMTTLPFDLVPWGVWKEAHPDGVVLSKDTGSVRAYDRSPYGPYIVAKVIYFPFVNDPDKALRPKDIVLGVVTETGTKAYQEGPIVEFAGGVKNDVVGETNVVVWFDDSERVLRAHERGDVEFESSEDGTLIDTDGNVWELSDVARDLVLEGTTLAQLQVQTMFWFEWSSLYQESQLYAVVFGKGLVDGEYKLEEGEGREEDEGQVIEVIDPSFGAPSAEVEAE